MTKWNVVGAARHRRVLLPIGLTAMMAAVAVGCAPTPATRAGFASSAAVAAAVASLPAVSPADDTDPITNEDDVTTLPGHAVTFNVLANDVDPRGLPLMVTSESQPFAGLVLCTPTGDCTYMPTVGFRGTDAFAYVADDGQGGSAIGVAVITVADPPTASFTVGSSCGRVPLDVQFDASASTDPGGSIESYDWDFGDGTTASGPTADHTYTTAGTFQAVLTITDDLGQTATDTVAVPVLPTFDPTRIVGNAVLADGGVLRVDLTRYDLPFGLKPVWAGSVGFLDQPSDVAALAWVLTHNDVVDALPDACTGATIKVTATNLFHPSSRPLKLSLAINDLARAPGDSVSLSYGSDVTSGPTTSGDLTVR